MVYSYCKEKEKENSLNQKGTKMEEGKKVINKNGVGFSGLLTVAFIVLKLCNVIDWSWLWVLAPLWISWGLALLIVIITFISVLIVKIRAGY